MAEAIVNMITGLEYFISGDSFKKIMDNLAQQELDRLRKISEDANILHFKRNARIKALETALTIRGGSVDPNVIIKDADLIYGWIIKEDI